MATLYITEYGSVGLGQTIAQEPPIASQTVAIGGTTTSSSAFNNATVLVRLHTDAICSVEFGTSPTATAAKRRMAADQTEYFAVSNGGAMKVAAITNT